MPRMGSRAWFKALISLKKEKFSSSKQLKGSSATAKSNAFRSKNRRKETITRAAGILGISIEDVAAMRIQTAFRAYTARKALRRLKANVRLQILTQGYSVQKQATNTISYLHSWSKIQSQIRARRLCMVTEGRIRQKQLENQLKLEAKLHDLEIEWCGGSESKEETLAKIHQREEAAVKRERAMAYAFSHQWRANASLNHGLGNYELGKENWGWSWTERWIAVRPWESRVPVQSISPNKAQNKLDNKVGKNLISPTLKTSVSMRISVPNGKITTKARRLSYPAAEKPATHEDSV